MMNANPGSTLRRYLPLLAIAIAAAGLCAPAIGQDVAKLAPKDTVFMLAVPNVSAARERFKKTSTYALYKDPSMQRFVQPTEKNIEKLIREKLQEAWSKMEMEGDAKIPWPQGKVVFLLRLETKTVKVPIRGAAVEGGGQGKQPVTEYRERTETDGQFLLVAEMGDNLELAKRLAGRVTENQISEGLQRRRRTVRGVEVITLRKPTRQDGGKAASDDSDEGREASSHAFRGQTMLLGSDEKLLTDVLARMSGAEAECLSDDESYRATFRALGTGDAVFYLNIKRLIEASVASVPKGGRAQVKNMIRLLGAGNLEGLGGVVQIAPRENENMRLKLLLKIQGERTGIPATLVPPGRSTEPSRLLTEGLSGFIVANHDLGKTFEQIVKIVRQASGFDIGVIAQNAMGKTAGVGGEEPVNLQMDLLNQLSGPITAVTRVRKPYISDEASQTHAAIGVRDGSVLDSTVGRILDAFLPQRQGGMKHRREIRGKNVYVLPLPIPVQVGGDGPPALAITVAGGNLVIASVNGAEQAIRDLDRKDIRSIRMDPMYQYAARALPAQASIYFYSNDQIQTAVLWARVREAARLAAGNPAPMPPTISFTPTVSMLTPMIGELKKYCDLTTLPEFESVRKHFGASVGYVTGTDQGIHFETVSLKAPPK